MSDQVSDQINIDLYDPRFESQVIELWMQNFDRPSSVVFKHDIDMAAARKPCLFYAATQGEKLLGTCIGARDGHRNWIYYLCVEKDSRRKGLGTTLLRHVERAMHAEGCLQVGLHAQRENYNAIDFYLARGYFKEDSVSLGKNLD